MKAPLLDSALLEDDAPLSTRIVAEDGAAMLEYMRAVVEMVNGMNPAVIEANAALFRELVALYYGAAELTALALE